MTLSLSCQNGILLEVPHDDHGPLHLERGAGGTCWLARIATDRTQPGNVQRAFLPRATPGLYRLHPPLPEGCPLEFGVNDREVVEERPVVPIGPIHTVRGSRPRKRRWYGHVVEATPTALVLAQGSTAAKAILRGQSHALALQGGRRGRTYDQVRELLADVRSGRLDSLLILCDLLKEADDPRGPLLWEGVRQCVDALFPDPKEEVPSQ